MIESQRRTHCCLCQISKVTASLRLPSACRITKLRQQRIFIVLYIECNAHVWRMLTRNHTVLPATPHASTNGMNRARRASPPFSCSTEGTRLSWSGWFVQILRWSFFFSVCCELGEPLSGGIGSGVKSWQTTFKLVHWAVVYDVWHGLGILTNAQWVVSVAPLVETGCTARSGRAETVEKTPLTSGKVETRDESCWVVNDVGVYRRVSLPGFSP